MFAFRDIKRILGDAKKNLQDNYEKGDQVYVFGFSLGAATARMFAAKIKEYKPDVESVKLLGVFDTVLSSGETIDLDEETLPSRDDLFEEGGKLGEHIETAVHLVALDERRIAFQSTLFNEDERVKEVWLPGVHSDIGGGFWFDGLSDTALEFMCEEAEEAGLQFLNADDVDYVKLDFYEDTVEDEDKICRDDLEINSLPKGVIHNKERSGLGESLTLAPRSVCVIKGNRVSKEVSPIIHYTVVKRFAGVTGYRPVSLRNKKYRLMGKNHKVFVNDEGKEVEAYGIKGLRESKAFFPDSS